ncbi:MAG: DUF3325 domain-containing protein [Panacagrimonas sp.]
MADSWNLAMALACSCAGLGWFALSLDAHARQVFRRTPPRGRRIRVLRMSGGLALLLSLVFCLRADHPSMAILVWIMSLAAGALIVSFTLAYRPRWLAPLVLWH